MPVNRKKDPKPYSKGWFLEQYGGIDPQTFADWIEPIKADIGWRKGKQVFNPKQAQIIFDHLGEPFELKLPL